MKDPTIDNITVDNEVISDKEKIASHFNVFFSNVASDIISKLPPTAANFADYLPPPCNETFSFYGVSVEDIINTVASLENKTSQDIFGISSFFLKKVIKSIARPLAYIATLSFQEGVIPSQFKISKTIPIFKTGNKTDMNNYRPIGLIPAFSKIFEKLASNCLSNYLDRNNLLYEHQYGFRKNHSTLHPMIHLLNNIAEASNNKEFLLAIFCDLQKCFDVLNREILLKKMENLGVHGNSLKWFKNYFESRLQHVYIGNFASPPSSPNLGVIQGSILGPLLTSIYLNDLHLSSKKFLIFLFADDSTCTMKNSNLESLISEANIEFQKVAQWMRANRLMLHPEKTKMMIFCNRQKSINLDLCNIFLDNNDCDSLPKNENLIKPVECLNRRKNPNFKLLGLIMDPHLSFNCHLSHLAGKLSKSLYLLRSVKNLLPTSALLTLYYSLFHSHLYYALPAYGCAERTSLNQLFLLQKKAVRLISGSHYNSHTDPIFKKNGHPKII